jgi:hypothetical protein
MHFKQRRPLENSSKYMIYILQAGYYFYNYDPLKKPAIP